VELLSASEDEPMLSEQENMNAKTVKIAAERERFAVFMVILLCWGENFTNRLHYRNIEIFGGFVKGIFEFS
jgi:hypothetical protein